MIWRSIPRGPRQRTALGKSSIASYRGRVDPAAGTPDGTVRSVPTQSPSPWALRTFDLSHSCERGFPHSALPQSTPPTPLTLTRSPSTPRTPPSPNPTQIQGARVLAGAGNHRLRARGRGVAGREEAGRG